MASVMVRLATRLLEGWEKLVSATPIPFGRRVQAEVRFDCSRQLA